MNYNELIEACAGEKLIRIVLSKPVNPGELSKMKIRPVIIRDRLMFQAVSSVGNKESNTCREVHENLDGKGLIRLLSTVIPDKFLQGLFEYEGNGYTVMANKKGTITLCKNKTVSEKQETTGNNRTKNYVLPEGEAVPFLVDLGVMTSAGMVVKAKYDKFRQINRYLEFVEDIAGNLAENREITIVDFGCGKSYLTFALYYYLSVKRRMNVRIIGLDLKPDVIRDCNRLAKKYKYDKLLFIEGDIEHYEGVNSVDMVITLHACDTATDYAIDKAVKWGAKVVMAVPCCQHELNKKISCEALEGVTQYGLLKDRLSAVLTDAMRANALKSAGYETQILEFIDMEHTPKNLMIRAVKKEKMLSKAEIKRESALYELIGSDITLTQLLKKE